MSDLVSSRQSEKQESKENRGINEGPDSDKLLSTSGLLSIKDDSPLRTMSMKVQDSLSVFCTAELPFKIQEKAIQHAKEHPLQLGEQVLIGVAIGAGIACAVKNPGLLGKSLSHGILETAERSAPVFAGLGAVDWTMRVGMPLAHAYKTGDVITAREQAASNIGIGAMEYAAGGLGGGLGAGLGAGIATRMAPKIASEAILNEPFNRITALSDAEAMSQREFEIRRNSRIHHRYPASDGIGTALEGAQVKVTNVISKSKVRLRQDKAQAGESGVITELSNYPSYGTVQVKHSDGNTVPYEFKELSPAILRSDLPLDPRAALKISNEPLKLSPGDRILTTDKRLTSIEVDPTLTHGTMKLKPLDPFNDSTYGAQASEVQRSGKFSAADPSKRAVDAVEGETLTISDGHWIPSGKYQILERRDFHSNDYKTKAREIENTLYTVKEVGQQGALIEGTKEVIGIIDFRFRIAPKDLTTAHFLKIEPAKLSAGDTIALPEISHSPIKDDWRWESLKGRALHVEQVTKYGALLSDLSGRQKLAIPADFLATPYIQKVASSSSGAPLYKLGTGGAMAGSVILGRLTDTLDSLNSR
ncbi:MAG: hypothetical protein K2X27_22085 [Candidatus Obscuribacterales bacterium]|nr:hypothetical protein [Candidatus Obscuribacterales bacterium]